VMRAEVVEQRMEAMVRKARCDAGELQRRPEELLTQRRASSRVVAGVSIGRLVTEGLVRIAIVREARGDDGTVADDIAPREFLFHHHAEGIAFAEGKEVDVPLEDIDELLHELRPRGELA